MMQTKSERRWKKLGLGSFSPSSSLYSGCERRGRKNKKSDGLCNVLLGKIRRKKEKGENEGESERWKERK